MTLLNFGKIAALSAVTFSLVAPGTAQTQAQTYQQQQQAYYEGWQQYYRQQYGVNYHQPTFQNRRGYTTQQPQRTQSWNAPQQPQQQQTQPQKPTQQRQAPAQASDPTENYPAVQTHPSGNSASPINLDARENRAPQISTADNNVWYNSFEPAWKSAYKQGRPLVLLFVHEGCPECIRMDGFLSQPGAMETLASAVKARIEFTENAATVTRFGVKFTPTFLVLNPQGNEAYREVGALDVNRLRQIQPAIDSLVTAPPQSDTVKAQKSNAENKLDFAATASELPAKNTTTSQTLAAL